MIPTTIEEAYQGFDKMLADDPKAEADFMGLKRAEDVIQYHTGFGRWIRNNWGLWYDSALAQVLKAQGVTGYSCRRYV